MGGPDSLGQPGPIVGPLSLLWGWRKPRPFLIPSVNFSQLIYLPLVQPSSLPILSLHEMPFLQIFRSPSAFNEAITHPAMALIHGTESGA